MGGEVLCGGDRCMWLTAVLRCHFAKQSSFCTSRRSQENIWDHFSRRRHRCVPNGIDTYLRLNNSSFSANTSLTPFAGKHRTAFSRATAVVLFFFCHIISCSTDALYWQQAHFTSQPGGRSLTALCTSGMLPPSTMPEKLLDAVGTATVGRSHWKKGHTHHGER